MRIGQLRGRTCCKHCPPEAEVLVLVPQARPRGQSKFAARFVTEPFRVSPVHPIRRLRHRMAAPEDEDLPGNIETIEVEARTTDTTVAEDLRQGDVIARPDPPLARG